MTDELDRAILHALQHAPRAPFSRIADVIGVSEQTVGRRYQALRRAGVMRVIGLVNPAVYGQMKWVVRIRCRPDRVDPLADALVRRPEIAYANLASAGTEIICIIRSPVSTPRDDVLFRQLPKSAAVLQLGIDLLIHAYAHPDTPGWTGYGAPLTPEQSEQLAGPQPRTSTGPPEAPTDQDAALLAALAEDGRATHTRLAELTGWPATRVARRLEALEACGALVYDVDLLPEQLGYHLNATIWLRVAPARLHQIGTQLAGHDEVAFTGAISGEHNLMAIVVCRDADDFYRYLTNRFAAIPGIDSYTISIRVRRLKQAASLIAHGRLIHPA
ncbi:MAG TPA: AsnC family transcriptional regulator [Actinocrinis sp.]|nr:AsnC family transcriptional regulator [Actinocrinis sp.]